MPKEQGMVLSTIAVLFEATNSNIKILCSVWYTLIVFVDKKLWDFYELYGIQFPFSFRSYDIQSLLVTIGRRYSQSCIFRIANIFSRSARKLISFKDEKSVRFRKSQNQRDLLFQSYLPLNDIRYFNLSQSIQSNSHQTQKRLVQKSLHDLTEFSLLPNESFHFFPPTLLTLLLKSTSIHRKQKSSFV